LTLTNAGVNHIFSGAADATCGITDVVGQRVCHIGGQLGFSFRSPETSLTAQFVFATSTTLRTTNGGAGVSCPLGAGEPSHQTTLTIAVTSGPAPTIVRTA
jgi:hypothetical protein